MRRCLWWFAGIAAVLAGVGFLVAWSGIVNIGASTGHWEITRWALHSAMRQSVETHSMGITVPELDDPALVLRGAGHYATGCAPCHGAPGQPRSPVALAMTPHPPDLTGRIDDWDPEELFWIVRNGVKFTAMPAWVAYERTDEVWAMVAFLLRMPDLDPAAWRRLAFGGAGAAPGALPQLGTGAVSPVTLTPATLDEVFGDEGFGDVLANCARCHGADGAGRGLGAAPRLTGQSEAYLLASLQAFAGGERHSGIMQPAAAGLSEPEMAALAAHFAAAEAPIPPPEGGAAGEADGEADGEAHGEADGEADAAVIARGREIALAGVPKEGIPACAVCHGPGAGERHPLYPALAGQYADYIELQLWAWRQDVRGGTPFAHIMRTIADRLPEDQARAVALYYQSLVPKAPNDTP
jgi:cytochrome c553